MLDEDEEELVMRLQRRLQTCEPGPTLKRPLDDHVSFHSNKKKPLPRIKPLVVQPQRSEISKYSWAYHVLQEVKKGKPLHETLPKPTVVIPQVTDEKMQQLTRKDMMDLEMILKKNANVCIAAADSFDDDEAPLSPGKEFDVNYLNTYNSEVSAHELMLNTQEMDAKDRQKLISCAKGIEKSLMKRAAPKRRQQRKR